MKAKDTPYPMVCLEEVCDIHAGKAPDHHLEDDRGRTIPFIKSGARLPRYIYAPDEFLTKRHFDNEPTLYPKDTVIYAVSARNVGILKIKAAVSKTFIAMEPKADVLPEFIYWLVKSKLKNSPAFYASKNKFPVSGFRKMIIPLPTLKVQKKVIKRLNHLESVIAQAKTELNNCAPVIEVDPSWQMVELGEIFEEIKFGNDSFSGASVYAGYKVVNRSNISFGKINENDSMDVISLSEKWVNTYRLFTGDILFVGHRALMESLGLCAIFDLPGVYVAANNLWRLRVNKQKADPVFLTMYMNTTAFRQQLLPLCCSESALTRGNQYSINKKEFVGHKVPLPPLAVQKQLSVNLDKWRTTANAYQRIIDLNEIQLGEEITNLFKEPLVKC